MEFIKGITFNACRSAGVFFLKICLLSSAAFPKRETSNFENFQGCRFSNFLQFLFPRNIPSNIGSKNSSACIMNSLTIPKREISNFVNFQRCRLFKYPSVFVSSELRLRIKGNFRISFLTLNRSLPSLHALFQAESRYIMRNNLPSTQFRSFAFYCWWSFGFY